MRRSIWWPIIIILSAIGTALVTAGNMGVPARSLITFWFLLVCPGMAFTRLLQIEDVWAELMIAIALSIAMGTIVAETMVLTQRWLPQWGLVVLICISLVGAVLQIMQGLNLQLSADRQKR